MDAYSMGMLEKGFAMGIYVEPIELLNEEIGKIIRGVRDENDGHLPCLKPADASEEDVERLSETLAEAWVAVVSTPKDDEDVLYDECAKGGTQRAQLIALCSIIRVNAFARELLLGIIKGLVATPVGQLAGADPFALAAQNLTVAFLDAWRTFEKIAPEHLCVAYHAAACATDSRFNVPLPGKQIKTVTPKEVLDALPRSVSLTHKDTFACTSDYSHYWDCPHRSPDRLCRLSVDGEANSEEVALAKVSEYLQTLSDQGAFVEETDQSYKYVL